MGKEESYEDENKQMVEEESIKSEEIKQEIEQELKQEFKVQLDQRDTIIHTIKDQLECTQTQRDNAKEQHQSMSKELEAITEQLNILRKKMNYDSQRFVHEKKTFEKLREQYNTERSNWSDKNIKKNKRINDLIKDCTNYQNMVQTLENENRVLQLKLDSIEFKKNAESEEDNPEGKIPNLLERLRNTEIYIN